MNECSAFFSVCIVFKIPFWCFNHLRTWQIEMFCKTKIAFVVRWNGHHSTCPVTCQHIVANPNWNFFVRKGMNDIRSGKFSGNIFYFCLTFTFCAVFRIRDVSSHFFFLCFGGDFVHQFVFRSKCYVAHTKNGIRSRGKHFNFY